MPGDPAAVTLQGTRQDSNCLSTNRPSRPSWQREGETRRVTQAKASEHRASECHYSEREKSISAELGTAQYKYRPMSSHPALIRATRAGSAHRREHTNPAQQPLAVKRRAARQGWGPSPAPPRRHATQSNPASPAPLQPAPLLRVQTQSLPPGGEGKGGGASHPGARPPAPGNPGRRAPHSHRLHSSRHKAMGDTKQGRRRLFPPAGGGGGGRATAAEGGVALLAGPGKAGGGRTRAEPHGPGSLPPFASPRRGSCAPPQGGAPG